MVGNQNNAGAGKNIFMSSVSLLANAVAIASTFFLTPMLYERSLAYVVNTTYQLYGTGWVDFIALAWFVICALLVFAISRASIGTALIFSGLAFAGRIL